MKRSKRRVDIRKPRAKKTLPTPRGARKAGSVPNIFGKDGRLLQGRPRAAGLRCRPIERYEAAMELASSGGVIPGGASVVMRGGKLAQANAFGFADLESGAKFGLDTICRVYCVTKTFVAVFFMMLVEDGLVRLDDPVWHHIPSFKDVHVVAACSSPGGACALRKPRRVMRLKHLLQHTSGLSYGAGFGAAPNGDTEMCYAELTRDVESGLVCDLRAFVDRLAKLPLRFHPGDRYEYGFSTDVLGRICEVVTGQTLEAGLRERLFAPLDMHDTAFAVPDEKLSRLAACYANEKTWRNLYGDCEGANPRMSRHGFVRVDGDLPEHSLWREGQQCKVLSGGGIVGKNQGGMVSTVADMSRFVCMLVERGIGWSGKRILKQETLAAMEKEQLDPAFTGEERQCLFGVLGGFSGEEFGWGGAACTYWSLDRKSDQAVVWFTQHFDMPEWEDQAVVPAADADIWAVLDRAAAGRP